MRQFILLALASFQAHLLHVNPVYTQDIGDLNTRSCTDKSGNLYSPGAVVPSQHHCRECVCGARGNIICESLNKIVECQPPDDAPGCRRINGTLCCERSFSCDRLVSCSHGGVLYQFGDTIEHSNEKCQRCKCGSAGQVKCQPVASCGVPPWIAELGGTECEPVYTADSCCPTDYLCRCMVFNDTITRGPRNVARCTTCSCSRRGGVENCEAVTCKIPYKFSDKCRAIYRGDDCCPVDYDCSVAGGKGKNRHTVFDTNEMTNDAAAQLSTAKPASRHHKWQSLEAKEAAQSGQAFMSRDDVLPYGQNEFTGLEKPGPLGRSDEVITDTTKPTKVTEATLVATTNLQRLRGGLEAKEPTNLGQMDAAWRTVNISQSDAGTDALLIGLYDGLVLDPKAIIISSSADGFTTKKLPVTSTTPATPQDALLDVFRQVAAKSTRRATTTTSSTTTAVVDGDTEFTTSPDLNITRDTLEYDTPQLTTPVKVVRGRHRSDPRTNRPTGGSNPGVWTSVGGGNTETGLGEPGKAATKATGLPSSTTEVTSATPLFSGFDGDGLTDTTPATSAKPQPRRYTTPEEKTPTSKSGDVILFTTQTHQTSTSSSTTARTTTMPFRGKFIGTGSRNTSRFSLDSPFSMSSADAGFLADDLSYKLFSVNFFRSPISTFTTTVRPPLYPPLGSQPQQPTLNFGNVSQLSDGTSGGQGQAVGIPGPNLTAAARGLGNAANATELDSPPVAAADEPPVSGANVTVAPDFQVVTFGALPRGGRKTAGKIIFPNMGGGGGGGVPPILPFETEVEFKGFGMMPEIEIKPLKGLAGLAGMAAMMANAGGGGGGGANLGGQLATGGGPAPAGNGGGGGVASGASRMAAAAAAQDAMEELVEGGTGDGAMVLAAAMMHNPHRPMPARLIGSTQIGLITTPPPTVAIVYPNNTLEIVGTGEPHAVERIGRPISLVSREGPGAALNTFPPAGSSRLAEFNAFFNSPNHNMNHFGGGMNNPWASALFGGASATTAPGVTPDPAAVTKDPFPFEAVADVIEEGRGPALTQLMGALQMMGRGMGGGVGQPNPYGMMPQPRGSMAGMNAMMNGGMGGMNRNFFTAYSPQMMGGMNSGMGGFGMEGMGGMGGLMGNRGLYNLFAGSLSALESNARPPDIGHVPGAARNHPLQASSSPRRMNPSMNSPVLAGENTAPILRPMYKMGSGLTESPLVGLLRQQPFLAVME